MDGRLKNDSRMKNASCERENESKGDVRWLLELDFGVWVCCVSTRGRGITCRRRSRRGAAACAWASQSQDILNSIDVVKVDLWTLGADDKLVDGNLPEFGHRS